jgi:hypothetical protein
MEAELVSNLCAAAYTGQLATLQKLLSLRARVEGFLNTERELRRKLDQLEERVAVQPPQQQQRH